MKNGNNTPQNNGSAKTLNLRVDDVPYLVTVKSYTFNDEPRYLVSINGGEEHTFVQDPSVGRIRAIDDSSALIPDTLEQAISKELSTIV